MDKIWRRRDFLEGALKFGAGTAIASLLPAACRRSEEAAGAHSGFFEGGDRRLLVIIRGAHPENLLGRGLGAIMETAAAGRPRRNLFLKPNATANEPYPVTSDPALLAALIEFFRSAGFARFAVSDNTSYRGMMVRKLFRDRGYFRLGGLPGVRVLPGDPGRVMTYVRRRLPGAAANPVILVNGDMASADLSVNVAIPKRHHEADFTCALKNNFGAVYDSIRTRAHLRKAAAAAGGTEFFDRTIAECAAAAAPGLTVVDARSLLVKAGPSLTSGGIVKDRVGEIIIGSDMVAVDSYCSGLLARNDPTYEPKSRTARQLALAEALGLGTAGLSRAEILEIHS